MFYFRKRTCLSFTISPIATQRKTWTRTKISGSLSQQTIFRNCRKQLRKSIQWFCSSTGNKPQSTVNESDKVIHSIIERARDFALPDSSLDKPISNEEIIRASKHLKNGKAIGNDAISNEMIKCFVQTRFVDVVRDLFNAILTKTYFPKLWKINYISPIFKSDDAFDPNNCRGIAVSSCFSKLFTLVIKWKTGWIFRSQKHFVLFSDWI